MATGPGTSKPFSWKCKNGVTIKLPSISTLDPDLGSAEDLAAAVSSGNDLVSMGMHVRFLTKSLPDGEGEKLRQLKSSEFEAFMKAWSEHSGVAPGELPAS